MQLLRHNRHVQCSGDCISTCQQEALISESYGHITSFYLHSYAACASNYQGNSLGLVRRL